jgi:NodT family efflux transporter outer membrane factor (OMF) lipoprotein
MIRESGVLIFCFLAGCAVGPDYRTPDLRVPATFAASPKMAPGDSSGQQVREAAQWWKSLNDPELDSLIDRAVTGNPNLIIALDRVQEARTHEMVVMGGALPLAGASYGGGWGTGSDLGRGRASEPLVASDHTSSASKVAQLAGFDAAWEIDLFGKYRRAIEAAKYDTQAVIDARNNVLISVIADVALGYIDLRARQMQLAVLQKNIENLDYYVRITSERYSRGITNELDVALARRELATLEAEKEPLTAQAQAAEYVIAVLLGKFPEELAGELSKPGLVPFLPADVAAGIPLDLLRRRPDVRQAEREAAASVARIGVAEADLFPSVALTAGAGYQGSKLGFGSQSSIWSVGPSVNWSILDFGALDGLVDIANLEAKAALTGYKQTVLNAVREVDAAIVTYNGEQDRLRNLGNALTASQRAVTLATERYNRGLTDALNVIDAERQEYDIENDYVESQQAAAEQFIDLYKALGGGWQDYQKLPAIRTPQPAILATFTRLLSSNDPVKE